MTNNGVAVNFGWPGMVVSGTGIGGANAVTAGLYQSVDHAKKADHDLIKDASGVLVTDIVFNPSDEATIEYVVMAISGTNTLANAITQSTIPAIGVIVTITLCSQYPALNLSTWRVEDASLKGTNTTAKVVTLKLVSHAGITAAAS